MVAGWAATGCEKGFCRRWPCRRRPLQHQQQKQRSFNILKEAKAKVEKRRRSYAGSLEMQLDASQPILSAYLLITPTSILVAVMMTCSAGLQHQQQKQRSFNILKEAKAKVEKRRRSYAGSLEMQLDASQPFVLLLLVGFRYVQHVQPRNFENGTCIFGDNCKYWHVVLWR